MFDILSIVAPVFGLVALGFVFGRLGWLSPIAEQGVSEFAFRLAIPALLMKTIATAEFGNLSIAGVWLSFYGAIATTYAASVLGTKFLLRRPVQDEASIAMSSLFGNAVMLGIPISLTTFGPAAAAPLALVLSIHAPSLWLATTLHARIADRETGAKAGDIVSTLIRDLGQNPIIIGIVLGGLWRTSGVPVPEILLKILSLLAQAGVPAALVALGLSLVRFEIRGQVPTLSMIVALKLLLMPLVAYALGRFVFHLDPLPLGVVTILASVPTGANAYIFAVKNGRAINSASGAVALGIVLSAFTVSLLLAFIKP
ncbi:MAG: AEC family transporter [Alphaproteobacteria bacterium]|nr:AEC family transporter [Alphaproteobacteria bacterium]